MWTKVGKKEGKGDCWAAQRREVQTLLLLAKVLRRFHLEVRRSAQRKGQGRETQRRQRRARNFRDRARVELRRNLQVREKRWERERVRVVYRQRNELVGQGVGEMERERG